MSANTGDCKDGRIHLRCNLVNCGFYLRNFFVQLADESKGARTKHSDIAYPINRAAREMLYSAVLQEYDRLRSEEELRRQETKLQIS